MKKIIYTALIFFALVAVFPQISFAGFDMTLRNPISDNYLGTIYSRVNNWFDNDKATNGLKIKFDAFNGQMCTAVSASQHSDNHKGIDFPVQYDTPIVSAGAGRIYYKHPDPNRGIAGEVCNDIGNAESNCGGGAGNHYKIDHEGDTADGKGLVTVYAHMKATSVALPVGTKVSCGQQLGLSASSGRSTGPHLHFAVSTKGENIVANYIDPFVGMCSRPNGDSSGLPRWSGVDGEVQPTTTCDPRPLAPSNLRVTDSGLNENKLTLEYKDNALNDTGIKLERKTGTGGWKHVFTIPATNNSNVFEYFANSDLTPGMNYCYRMKSIGTEAESPYSNEACGTTKISNSAPVAPSNVKIYDASTPKTLQVEFQDNSLNENDIKVERKSGWFNLGSWKFLKSLGSSDTEIRSFTDTNLSSFQRYCYRLKATNQYGPSNYSEEKCGNTLVSPDAPKAPTELAIKTTNNLLNYPTTQNILDNQNTSRPLSEKDNSIKKENVSIHKKFLQIHSINNEITKVIQNNGFTSSKGATITLTFRDNAIDETEFRIERKRGNEAYVSYKNLPAYPGTGLQTFTDTNVAINTTYCYKVRAYNSVNETGYSDYSNEVCGYTTSTDAVPVAPSGVYISDTTTTSQNVNFTDNALNEKFIHLEYKTGSNFYQNLATFGTLEGTTAWYVAISNLTPDTQYCYRLRASNNYGYSSYSNESCATTLKTETIPNAPTNPNITNVTANSMRFNFVDNAENETVFVIERKEASNAYISLGEFNAIQGTGPIYYDDANLKQNTQYCYRVKARNNAGDSAYTTEVCATTLRTVNIPNTPSNVYLSDITANSLWVHFKDNATNETSIVHEVKIGNNSTYGVLKTDNTLAGTESWQFQHYNLTPNTTYCYRSKARNADGDSPYSNEACGRTLGSTPNAPSDTYVNNITASSLRFNFRDNALDETGFTIERKINFGSWEFLENINGLSGNYFQWLQYAGLSSETTYCFRIKASNASGSSAYSNEACGTTLGSVPNAPSNVYVDNISLNSFRVHWKDNSLNETGFSIERKLNGGAWSAYGYYGIFTGTFYWNWDETGLNAGTEYCYRIKATNSYGSSSFSNEGCGITKSLPSTPSNVYTNNPTRNSLNVNFKDNSIDENYFLIEQKTGYNGVWQYDGYISGKAGTSYWYWTETGLSPGTYYCFRMYAQNNYGNSQYYSNEGCGTTLY